MQQLDDIINTDLSEQEREHLHRSSDLWDQMKRGKHLDDWLSYTIDIVGLRKLAVRYTNAKPGTRPYNELFGPLLARYFPGMSGQEASYILWINDDPLRLQILNDLRREDPRFGAKVTTPGAACKHIRRVLKERYGGEGVKASDRVSPTEQISALKRRVAELEERLKHADEGSLFDLKRDDAESIERIIFETTGPAKSLKIAKLLTERHAKLKRKPAAPAG